ISDLGGKDFHIYGYVDQGFTWNPASPVDRNNGLVFNNYRSNAYQMNAIYVVAEKKISDQQQTFQLGGRADLVYGTDARFMTVDGFADNMVSDDASRFYKLAFRQAHLNLFLPIGKGLSVKIGNYVSPIGQETGYAPANFFYSHLLCDNLQPGSPTGLLFEYPLTDQWTFRFGPNLGWGTLNNINHSVSYAGSVSWTSRDKKTQLQLDYQDGIQRTQVVEDTSLVMYYSLILNHQVTDRIDYIMEHDLLTSNSRQVPSNPTDNYQCYSLANYLVYKINEKWKSGIRVEWLQNNGGRLTGVDSSQLAASGNYYDVTLGLNWQARPHVRFRPELRYDWQSPYQPQDQPLSYDDNTAAKQWLFSCDVLWEF
ncbi:MAG: outer membrane beta-barrel protein, partial [Pirellulaceae bacterium]|nr:outer membrane beta-barrel protein [Pirellulaceae bacterium]